MAQVIELEKIATDAFELENAIDQTVASIRRGEIIVVAIEHAYVYACDAFDPEVVRRMHALRGDDFGISSQVMIGNTQTLEGIAQSVTADVKKLIANFWPGLLTLNLKPHSGLNWDLGDGGELEEFAVRIPDREFFKSILKKSGPVAISSAALVGRPPVLDIGAVTALAADIGIFVDEGILSSGPSSTVIQCRTSGLDAGLKVLRISAITFEQIQEILPNISMASA